MDHHLGRCDRRGHDGFDDDHYRRESYETRSQLYDGLHGRSICAVATQCIVHGNHPLWGFGHFKH